MNISRRYSVSVCFVYGLEEKDSKSEVIFAVCRLPFITEKNARQHAQDEIRRIRKRETSRIRETVPETRQTTCVSVSGFVTVTGVSVAAYRAEAGHFLCLFPSSFI